MTVTIRYDVEYPDNTRGCSGCGNLSNCSMSLIKYLPEFFDTKQCKRYIPGKEIREYTTTEEDFCKKITSLIENRIREEGL